MMLADDSPKRNLMRKWETGQLTLDEVKSHLEILRLWKLKQD